MAEAKTKLGYLTFCCSNCGTESRRSIIAPKPGLDWYALDQSRFSYDGKLPPLPRGWSTTPKKLPLCTKCKGLYGNFGEFFGRHPGAKKAYVKAVRDEIDREIIAGIRACCSIEC